MGTSELQAIKNRKRCVSLAKRGLSAMQIAAETGLHQSTVWEHLKVSGVVPRSKRTTAPLVNKAKVLKLVEKLGAGKAAEKLKVSRQAIYQRLSKWAALAP